MKLRLLFTLICALFFIAASFSQALLKDSIHIKNSALGTLKYFRSERRLDIPEVSNYLQSNPEAYKYFKKSRTANTLSVIFGVVGGFFVGWELGNIIQGNPVDWQVMAPGLVLSGVGLAFDIGSKKSAKRSVHIYNAPYR